MYNNIELQLRKFVAPEFIFGLDARFQTANYCHKYGVKKLFFVTDKGLLNTLWINEIEDQLKENNIDYEIFSDISPNPRDYEVMQGSERYLKNKCNIILSVGGGSVLDCAKGIAIVSTNRKDIKYFEGIDKIENPMPPLICIPTTSGTAADVSQFAIINNTTEKYKMAIISKAVVPDVSLIDPVVLTSMSNFLTACTAMDALCHAVESFVSNASSTFTDLYATEAIKLINENIEQTLKNPSDIQLRGRLMLASLYAGLAFSNASLGCVHSMAHSLGGYLDLPHGECNAILLPHVINFNFNGATEKYIHIAELLKLKTIKNSKTEIKKDIFNYISKLNKQIGINETLKQKGVTTDLAGVLASKAIKDPCNATNPVAPKKQDLETIYKEAL